MTTPKRNEAVALWVPNGHVLPDGSWEPGPGDLVSIDEACDFQKQHGFPLYPQSALDALQGEVSRLEQRFSDMRKVLFRLHAAYCEVSPNMTRAQRHEGRLALIAATEAMHPQWQGLTNLEPPINGR